MHTVVDVGQHARELRKTENGISENGSSIELLNFAKIIVGSLE